LRGEISPLDRTAGHYLVVMGVSVTRALAVMSSAGPGDALQNVVLLSSYSPSGHSPT